MKALVVSIAVAAGIAVGVLMIGDPDSDVKGPSGGTNAEFEAFRADVEGRFSDLEKRLDEIVSQIEVVQSVQVTDSITAPTTPESMDESIEETIRRLRSAFPSTPTTPVPRRRRDRDRLLDAGFSAERIDWLNRRVEEIRVESQQQWYDAQHSSDPSSSDELNDTFAVMLNPKLGLRGEMDDWEFERYLDALGEPTTVGVIGVLSSSPAEEVGLRVGDEIVSYGGERVFSIFELNALVAERTPGDSAMVEVRRNGQSLQVVLPSGPLGITGDVFGGSARDYLMGESFGNRGE